MLDPAILKMPICLHLEYLVEFLGPDYGSRQRVWRAIIGFYTRTIGDRLMLRVKLMVTSAVVLVQL